MAAFLSSLFSCWTSTFNQEWIEEQGKAAQPQNTIRDTPKPTKQKDQGSVSIVTTRTKETIDGSSDNIEEYESTVEWDCWDDEEGDVDTETPDIEIPSIPLPPTGIKATIVTSTKQIEEPEEEEDFFSDMEPEFQPAKRVYVEEKQKETVTPASSLRIKMASMDDEDDIVSYFNVIMYFHY